MRKIKKQIALLMGAIITAISLGACGTTDKETSVQMILQ